MSIDFDRCFATSYSAARAKFAAAAAANGAKVLSCVHPDEKGPAGEALAIDVAHLGDKRATRQLVVISGTHGQEGIPGSAAQIAWMLTHGTATLAPDMGVLMIHGLNPYGFAHDSRSNEANVDLNRNFVDHASGAYPVNAGYAELHPFLITQTWDRETARGTEEALTAFREKHGHDALFDTLVRGQYTHPDGLMYGGRRREWSNRMLEAIVSEHLAPARKVGLIDWHTGIGNYAESFFLCFNEEGSELYERAADWWGAERIKGARPHGLARPDYQGLVFHGVQAFLGERPVCGAVIEFGTRGLGMRRALRLDQWLRFKAERSGERYVLLLEDMRDAFRPVDQKWRDSVVDLGTAITAQAIEGMKRWA